MCPLTRRQFLHLAGLAAAGMALPQWPAWARVGDLPYEVTIEGEDFRFGHRIRDGEAFPMPPPSVWREVVIIGGGLSGLRAAHALRHDDVLLLEASPRLGGHATSGEWHGQTYAEGTLYITEPSEALEAFFAEIGYRPRRLPKPTDVLLDGRRIVPDFFDHGASHLPYGPKAAARFRQFVHDIATMAFEPDLPFDRLSPAQSRLDHLPFGTWLKPYGPELLRLMEGYCQGTLGGGVHEVSTLAGLFFFQGEVKDQYSLPGGMAGVATCMAAQVEKAGAGRMWTGCPVVRVQPLSSGALVTCLRHGEPVTIAAKAVIVAASKHVAKQIVQDLPPTQRAAMAALTYAPYLVSTVLVANPTFRPGYAVWTPGAGSLTDVIFPDWGEKHPRKDLALLTLYHPLPPSERALLLNDGAILKLIDDALDHVDRAVPGLKRKVRAVRCFRRGHALVRPVVGGISRLLPLIHQPVGAISFAHSDGQMLPCLEAALYGGEQAAKQARAASVRNAARGQT